MGFADQLKLILEDRPQHDPLGVAVEILRSMDLLKQQLTDLQHRLITIKRRMSANLALAIRKNHPGLNVSVDQTRCRVGYRSKSLVFDPVIENGVWVVTGDDPRFLGRFKRQFGRSTILSSDLSPLVSAIVDYFTGHYKSLGEDIIGTGLVLLEGKRASLGDLIECSEFPTTKRLNTRLARQVG